MYICMNTTEIEQYFVNCFHIMTKRDNIKYKRYQYVLAQYACLFIYQLRTDKHTGDKEMFLNWMSFFMIVSV